MKKGLTFEKAVSRLEEIVDTLQGGTVSLEDSLKLYEEGAALSKDCYTLLQTAEQRVKTLTEQEATDAG